MSSPAESPTVGPAVLGESADRFDLLLASLRRRLDSELAGWLRRRHDGVAEEAGAATRELTGRLEDFVLRGGKRLRPALVYYAYRGCGGEDDSQVMPAAMASELLHAYLLIHDDIMDRAETRRGGTAAHLAFRDQHREAGWKGSAGLHGEASAILLGDLAHSYAVELFASTDPRPADWPEVSNVFHTMCHEVVVGQYLEMTAPFREAHTEEALLQILRMKSGRYSVERPIQIGARLAGAGEASLDALSRYGLGVGEAFQLKDDLLGVFGELDAVGKPVGGDLREGKYTVLIHRTLLAAGERDRQRVLAVLGNQEAGDDEVGEACRIIEAVGARTQVEEMVDDRMTAARRELDDLEVGEEGREFFAGLLRFLKERKN